MYSGVSDPRRWVLPLVLEEQAERIGHEPFATFVSGERLTYHALRDEAAQVAAMLVALGGRAGDRIAIMLPNDADFLRAWAGVGRLGAIAVLLNTELTGAFLAHQITEAAPKIAIVDQSCLDILQPLIAEHASITHVVVVGGDGALSDDRVRRFADWRNCPPLQAPFPAAMDIACIMFTSGTSGPPKGVLMPHAHCFLFGLGVIENIGLTDEDHYYVCLPLFHANGLLMQLGSTLIAGASATVRKRFSATSWLEDVHACGATVTHSLGAIGAFIAARPPSPADRSHRLRTVLSAPNPPQQEAVWRERFGIAEVVGAYGMTEVNIPLYGERHQSRPGTCGRVYGRYFDVEIHDPESGLRVAVGGVGEIVVRPRIANGFMAGYHNLPEKTVTAWRDLWFHTGDAGRMDEDGYITFIDRIKDCIRRRGENISATDLETSFLDLAGVAEIAAYAVPSEHLAGEDEIMLAIVCSPGAVVQPKDVAHHAVTRLPRFARPRFLVFMATLPKTDTAKIRKTDLRRAGITPNTIDLESFYRASSQA